jgi:hypothetical protein
VELTLACGVLSAVSSGVAEHVAVIAAIGSQYVLVHLAIEFRLENFFYVFLFSTSHDR